MAAEDDGVVTGARPGGGHAPGTTGRHAPVTAASSGRP